MLTVKQKLQIACIMHGITIEQWANEIGITQEDLEFILSGIIKSTLIQMAIVDLIRTGFEKLKIWQYYKCDMDEFCNS